MFFSLRDRDQEAERYRRLVELQGDYLSLATGAGDLLYVNAAYARLHGLTRERLIGRSLYDFVPADQRPALKRRIEQSLAERQPLQSKNQVDTPEGRRWVLWTNLGFDDGRGGVMLHSVGRDIHAQVETETRLRESEARFRLIAEASPDVIMTLDRNLRRTYVSPACRELFGEEPEALIGHETGRKSHPEDFARLRGAMRSLLDGRAERHVCVSRRRHKAGHWVWLETCYRAVRDPATGAVSSLVAISRDITERKTAEAKLTEACERLEALAGQDGLTGLANRRIFDEALAREHARAGRGDERLCLLMIDVDRFKAFNDAYGHLAGDEALRRVAQALRPRLRRANDLAVRYGGEEFAVLSPGMSLEGGRHLAEVIRRAVRALQIPHIGSEHGVVTVSLGVAVATRDEFLRDRDRLAFDADAALYEAKRAGRDCVRLAGPAALRKIAGGAE